MIRKNIRIHETFTCIGIPKHWRLSWFKYETFITFFKFRLSTRGERDTIFTMPTVPSKPTTRGASRRPQVAWLHLAEHRKSTRSVQLQISTHCFFFKIPKNPSPLLLGMTSSTSPVLFPIRGFYYDICDFHFLPARAWIPALNVCPYPCTKPKSSKPNQTERQDITNEKWWYKKNPSAII